MRVHLFPSRTQKLSSCTPTILGGRLPGKIGNANTTERTSQSAVSFLCGIRILPETLHWSVSASGQYVGLPGKIGNANISGTSRGTGSFFVCPIKFVGGYSVLRSLCLCVSLVWQSVFQAFPWETGCTDCHVGRWPPRNDMRDTMALGRTMGSLHQRCMNHGGYRKKTGISGDKSPQIRLRNCQLRKCKLTVASRLLHVCFKPLSTHGF